MSQPIQQILTASEGRYLTAAEAAALREAATRLATRLVAIDELQNKESTLCDLTLREAIEHSAELKARYQAGKLTALRDLGVILRYVAQAAIRDDAAYLETQLLSWLGSVFQGAGLGGEPQKALLTALVSVARRELSPESAETLTPFLNQCARSATAPSRPPA